jgi:hypothetical protein
MEVVTFRKLRETAKEGAEAMGDSTFDEKELTSDERVRAIFAQCETWSGSAEGTNRRLRMSRLLWRRAPWLLIAGGLSFAAISMFAALRAGKGSPRLWP